MFELNQEDNRISKLTARTFSELNIKEREHLQEWIANKPSVLGEELLIIQKEFSGFSETKERLDLLALDKNGSLVIIENKRDDSGKNVVWQALKYVAYCSSLKKSEIIDIFEDYLRKIKSKDDASSLICEFLEKESIDEVNINSGTNQRFILVAADFRKEVTSTVLWLLSNGINAQCMTVTPYTLDERILLDIKQVIPTPEAEDYMISMSSKDSEEKETKTALKKRHNLRLQFWEQLLDYMRQHNYELFGNVSPSQDHWLHAGSGISGCPYTLIFGKAEARVEFNMQGSDKDENERIFDYLKARSEEIEKRFGSKLEWVRLNEKKACRIRFSKAFDGYNKESWLEMIEWLFKYIQKLEAAFKPEILKIPR